MTRCAIRALARVLVGCLLFMQLAIAAYACPAGLERLAEETSLVSSSAALADQLAEPVPESARWIGGLDVDLSNLCAEHCKSGQQSDQASTVVVPVALLTQRYVTPQRADTLRSWRHCAPTASALVAAAPSHAILHCVRRT